MNRDKPHGFLTHPFGPGARRFFRLPLEQALIEDSSVVRPCGIRIPSHEMGRSFSASGRCSSSNRRSSPRGVGLRRAMGRVPKKPPKKSLRAEFTDPVERADRERLKELGRRHADWISEGVVDFAISIAAGKKPDSRTLRGFRSRVMNNLQAGRQLSTIGEAAWGLLKIGWRVYTTANQRQRLPERRAIALIGADGAGRSSNLARVAEDLAHRLDVRIFHMGGKYVPWGIRQSRKLRQFAKGLNKDADKRS